MANKKALMVFHNNPVYNEEIQNQYKSLQSLVKYNDGNFKSDKQAKFLKTWASAKDNDVFDTWGFIKKEDYLKDGEYIISIDGWFEYGEGTKRGRGRANVPFTFLYIMDKHGVNRVYQLKYKAHKEYDEWHEVDRVHGWSPVGYEVKWVREKVTFHPEPEKPKAEEPKKESQWVGEVGKRIEVRAKVVYFKDFDSAYSRYGTNTLYIFVDEQGNKFKAFYSGSTYMDKGQWYTFKATVKEHEESRGEKVTQLTRLTKIQEVNQEVQA